MIYPQTKMSRICQTMVAKKLGKAQHNNIKSGDSDYDCPNENNTDEVVSSNNKLHNQTEDNEQISQQQNV